MAQAETALQNILAMIRGREPSATYTPNIVLEGTLKLTLGKVSRLILVTYCFPSVRHPIRRC